MYKKHQISVLILMGGEGARFQSDIPKQFHPLAGKRVFLHTLDIFLKNSPIFEEIIIVCPKHWITLVKKEISYIQNKRIQVVMGGKTRQESSYLGLIACQFQDIVLIHDGVRPFLSEEILFKNLDLAIEKGAVDTCIPSLDTLVQVKEKKKIFAIPKRSEFFRGQTPQTFSYSLIRKAHELAKEKKIENVSDDCALLFLLPHKVFVVEGSEQNIKITTPLDLFLAEQLFRLQTKTLGFSKKKDQISLEKKRYIILGGTGGIGKTLEKLLKKEKAEVISISRSSKPYSMDLKSKINIETGLKKIFKNFGFVDGLINCAGVLHVKPLIDSSFEEIEEQIQTNLTGLIYSSKLVKIKNDGHLIFLSSSSFSRGRQNFATYSATKAGVVNFTQALAEEFSHIRVNTIIPCRTNTPMRRKNFPHEPEHILLPPKSVAIKIIDLLKNSSKITGCLIEVRK